MPEADFTRQAMSQAINQAEETGASLRQSSSELAALGVALNEVMEKISDNQRMIFGTIAKARDAINLADVAIAGTASLKVSNGVRALAKVDAEQTNDVLRLAQAKRTIESIIRDILDSMQTSNREAQAQVREAVSEFRAYSNIL